MKKFRIVAFVMILIFALAPVAQAAPHPGPPPHIGGGPGPVFRGPAPHCGPGMPPPRIGGGPGPRPDWRGPMPHSGPGMPPPPPRYNRWHSHDNDWAWGIGAAIILGSIFANSSRGSGYERAPSGNTTTYPTYSQPRYDSAATEVLRTRSVEAAKMEAMRASALVSQYGVDNSVEKIISDWENKNRHVYFASDAMKVSTVTVTGFSDNSSLVYTFDRAGNAVTARIIVPDCGISESYRATMGGTSSAVSGN